MVYEINSKNFEKREETMERHRNIILVLVICAFLVLSGFVCSEKGNENQVTTQNESADDSQINAGQDGDEDEDDVEVSQTDADQDGDVIIVTTSLIQRNEAFDNTIDKYQEVLTTEGLDSKFIIVDSDSCFETYGIKADPNDWEEIKEVLNIIINETGASYVIILGSVAVVPRPVAVVECPNEDTVTMPSDAWYVDLNNDQIVDEGLSLGRFPDILYESSIVVAGLQTAIDLHESGGFTLNSRVEFSVNGHTTPPYGVCNNCTLQNDFFSLLSDSDYIVFVGHGSSSGISNNSHEPKLTMDYMDLVDFDTYSPVIISYTPSRDGILNEDEPSLPYGFLKAGAAVFVARTTKAGKPTYVNDNFLDDLENGVRIGEALFNAMREAVIVGGCKLKGSTGHICLYGDPTLKLKN